MSDQLVARPLPKYRTTQVQNKHIHTHTHRTSMPYVGFEPTIPASERAKTFHALDRAATVTGTFYVGNEIENFLFELRNNIRGSELDNIKRDRMKTVSDTEKCKIQITVSANSHSLLQTNSYTPRPRDCSC
jgi:hypothetical protein